MDKIITFICAAILLTGCGIKPSFVEPPEGVHPDPYPYIYPDQSTDPAPRH